MARPAPSELDEETVRVPAAVRFPIELTPPDGFDPARLETWPRVEGRLEWVGRRLLYMPPCGGLQFLTVSDLVAVLAPWARAHPEFMVGTNEAGMRLGEDARGADAAVWRRTDIGHVSSAFTNAVPVLAAEVAGQDETEGALREKAAWYLDKGVAVVWILEPATREGVVITRAGETRSDRGDCLREHPDLPGLAPAVDELFRQVSEAT